MYAYIYIHTCIHTYTRTHVHTLHTYIHTYMSTGSDYLFMACSSWHAMGMSARRTLTFVPVVVIALVIHRVLDSSLAWSWTCYASPKHGRHLLTLDTNTPHAHLNSVGMPNVVPVSPLYIITPCSRPEYLPAIRASLHDNFEWVWIIVYTAKPTARSFQRENDKHVFEFWPGIKESYAQEGEPFTFGNVERNLGISMVHNPSSFLYFLDDDNVVHPSFWKEIYPLILPEKHEGLTIPPDFITFDQLRAPGWLFPGAHAALFQIDTAMYIARRSLVGDSRWHMTRYNADGLFAIDMAAKSSRHVYKPCTCSYYNYLKQDFGKENGEKEEEANTKQ